MAGTVALVQELGFLLQQAVESHPRVVADQLIRSLQRLRFGQGSQPLFGECV